MEIGMLKRVALLSTVLVVASPVIAQDNDVKLPDGAGKPIVQRMCTGCHNLKTVTSKHATKEQWSATVQQMVSRGADGTDEEIETVIDYLAKNFPQQGDDKPASAPQSSLKIPHVGPDQLPYASLLTLSKTDEDAMLRRWRQAAR
jgi:cytochrome c5